MLQNRFEGFMNDTDLGDMFNRALTSLFPEILISVWDDMKVSNGHYVEDVSIHLISYVINVHCFLYFLVVYPVFSLLGKNADIIIYKNYMYIFQSF